MKTAFGPLQAEVIPIRRAEMLRADRELIWRETCWEFLDACFYGDTTEEIERLGQEVFAARNAMRAAR